MRQLKFSTGAGASFESDLKTRINEYFESKSRHANLEMILKTVFILGIYLGPLIIISSGLVHSIPLMFLLYLISGFGIAGIGMSIMHDALHGSYSNNSGINRFMGYSINLIGASAAIWKIQHNVLHHTYTNIDHADDDLNTTKLLRFSPDKDRIWIHRYQHIYAWFFYGLMTLVWVTLRDFIRLNQFLKMGFFKERAQLISVIASAVFWKIVYFTYALVLPLIVLPFSWWVIVLAFFSMHFVAGSLLSIVFQTAHIMPDSDFPKPDEDGMIGNCRSAHQLYTTSNYAPGSRIFSWFIGGLNYQIEHHLMPNICHVHYKKLSKIVKETAEQHGLPYRTRRTFGVAVWDHMKMLRSLGRA